MASCHSLLSRKTAAGYKAASSTSTCRPQLRPTTTLQHTSRCVHVAAAPNSSSWYEQSTSRSSSSSGGSGSNSGSSSGTGGDKQQRQRSRHYYDTTPKRGKHGSETAPSSRPRYQNNRENDHEEDHQDDENGPGWWEVPREVRRAQQQQQQAAAAAGSSDDMDLLPWQEERLLLAAAGSKKKMQVQALATDLGLDSSRKGKRLPAEVLRTLEGVYSRSPWPSKEVVAGLFDLHRLPRDIVLDCALPSPKKFKGAKLAEDLGIKVTNTENKAGKGPAGLEISGISFVARDGAKAWRGAWRRRRAAEGLPAQRLDFQQWFL
ncbi:hypothetical protein OEZ85_003406 [Tetradesmus obliquus]|uniref:Rho termination factor N-terminal domain-containing protein n=1 Tax=Tetradesmus obliquus TaxID=3088 RepID=A0ABY8UBM4_TETOB|nr:hypothetical protein OEZ85_003406 [Tetradesmus obliquus]